MTVRPEKEHVKTYSNDDDTHLALLGSVLHNEKSRAMYCLLSTNPNKEYYLKQMAVIIEKHDNPRLPIYEHHIKVMVKSGVVIVTEKMHNKHKTKFYKMSPFILLSPSKYFEKATKSKTFSNTFEHVFKFAITGVLPIFVFTSLSIFYENQIFFIIRIRIQQILKSMMKPVISVD